MKVEIKRNEDGITTTRLLINNNDYDNLCQRIRDIMVHARNQHISGFDDFENTSSKHRLFTYWADIILSKLNIEVAR